LTHPQLHHAKNHPSRSTTRCHCRKNPRRQQEHAQEAATVAHNLVLANLSGHDSHGVGMLPRYVDATLEGGLTPNTSGQGRARYRHLADHRRWHGFGQVIGEQAMALGMDRAKQHGSCIMTIKSAHHLGRIGHFSEMAVAQGLVSMHFVNVIARPIVAPWGGGDGRFGTNPCCIGIPLKGQPPFVLDFATSRVAQGKMRVAHNEGRSVPAGYLIDEKGNPTTDPGVVVVPQSNGLFGALMTFGEYKGYGMAVACELLGGALSGGATWRGETDGRAAVLNSMLSILIDPANWARARASNTRPRSSSPGSSKARRHRARAASRSPATPSARRARRVNATASWWTTTPGRRS
jgi:uncharacterized oxidoreductase